MNKKNIDIDSYSIIKENEIKPVVKNKFKGYLNFKTIILTNTC